MEGYKLDIFEKNRQTDTGVIERQGWTLTSC